MLEKKEEWVSASDRGGKGWKGWRRGKDEVVCACPAWRFQSHRGLRTCKHLVRRFGEAAERRRVGEEGWAWHADRAAARKARERPRTDLRPMRVSELRHPPEVGEWAWVGEKLNGFFVRWQDGELWTKEGHRVKGYPKALVSRLPKSAKLDAELHDPSARGRPGELDRVRRAVQQAQWPGPKAAPLQLTVFDWDDGGKLGFEARQHALQKWGIPKVRWQPAGSPERIRERLAEMVESGGEGLILRREGSRYEAGKRSRGLAKLKPLRVAEARVTSLRRAKARGRVTSMEVQLNGAWAAVAVPKGRKPPAVGAVVPIGYTRVGSRNRAEEPRWLRGDERTELQRYRSV